MLELRMHTEGEAGVVIPTTALNTEASPMNQYVCATFDLHELLPETKDREFHVTEIVPVLDKAWFRHATPKLTFGGIIIPHPPATRAHPHTHKHSHGATITHGGDRVSLR